MLILTDILKDYFSFVPHFLQHQSWAFTLSNGDMFNLDYVSSIGLQTLFKEDDPSELSQVFDAL